MRPCHALHRVALLGVAALVSTFLLPGAAQAETVPGAPTSVAAVAGRVSATVSWTAPSDSGGAPVTSYLVTADPGGATCSALDSTSCVVTGLNPGTPYMFTVVAANNNGPGAASGPSGPVTPTPLTAPSPPTGLVATGTVDAVMVSWTSPADDGGSPISGYTVTSNPDSLTCSTTDLSCTVTGLTAGMPYTFTVTATNAVGSTVSDVSGAVSPTPLPPNRPGIPTGVRATLIGRSAQVSWAPPVDGDGSPVTGYLLSTNGRRGVLVDGTSAYVSGLRYGRQYSFTVAAVTDAYTGSPSAATTPVTPLLGTALRITSVTPAYRYGGRAARVVGRWTRTDNARGFAGGPVELVSRPRGSSGPFRHWASARPSAGGVVALRGLRPTRNIVLRLVAPGGNAYLGATSTARSMRAFPVISAVLSRRAVLVGRGVGVTGLVRPGRAHQHVELQQHRGRRWVPLLLSSLTSHSRYAFTLRRPLAGRYVLRTVLAASALSGAAVSRPMTLRVSPARSATHAWLSHPSIRLGWAAQAWGYVEPTLARHLVYLQAASRGRWHSVARQRLDGTSTFVFTVAPRAGRHTYRVFEPGIRRRVRVSASRVLRLTVRAPVRPPPSSGGCTPGYRPCIPPGPDVDCAGGTGNGPRYVHGPINVRGSDPYGLDADGDGVACE